MLELKKKGLTQPEIAVEIGCSQPTISAIERGEVGKKRPSWKIVSGLTELAKRRGVRMPDAPKANLKRRSTDRATPARAK